MLTILKEIFAPKKRATAETEKLFNMLALMTRQEQTVENYLFKYSKLRRRARRRGDRVFISLYLAWEEFIVNDSVAAGMPTTKAAVRKKVSENISIDNLSRNFRLVFLDGREQLSYLYSSLVIELAEYVENNLGKNVLESVIKEAGQNTIFSRISFGEAGIDFEGIHAEIRTHPAEYPESSITRSYKSFLTAFYNKIELSLGEQIIHGIFRKMYENFKEMYNADFATLLLNVTPEKVLNLDEWLSILSKSELEKQVKEKTEALEQLNDSLEERVHSRTRELKEAYEELKELDRKKTEFISVAAHQIRTPVSGIKWVLNMMLQEETGSLSEEQKTFLEKAYSANEQLLVIVNNLLDVDMMSTGQAAYQFKKVDVFSIIRKTIAAFAAQAHSRNVRVSWNKQEGVDGTIEADEKRMQSVIENVIDNAVKYSDMSSEVSISTSRVDGNIVISVTNTGIGIPKDSRSDIFKRFFRAPNAMRLHANGSGLGLFIARNIVERHHGTLEFSSTEGKSTTFTITLPENQPVES